MNIEPESRPSAQMLSSLLDHFFDIRDHLDMDDKEIEEEYQRKLHLFTCKGDCHTLKEKIQGIISYQKMVVASVKKPYFYDILSKELRYFDILRFQLSQKIDTDVPVSLTNGYFLLAAYYQLVVPNSEDARKVKLKMIESGNRSILALAKNHHSSHIKKLGHGMLRIISAQARFDPELKEKIAAICPQ
jgi:hypothetical protein